MVFGVVSRLSLPWDLAPWGLGSFPSWFFRVFYRLSLSLPCMLVLLCFGLLVLLLFFRAVVVFLSGFPFHGEPFCALPPTSSPPLGGVPPFCFLRFVCMSVPPDPPLAQFASVGATTSVSVAGLHFIFLSVCSQVSLVCPVSGSSLADLCFPSPVALESAALLSPPVFIAALIFRCCCTIFFCLWPAPLFWPRRCRRLRSGHLSSAFPIRQRLSYCLSRLLGPIFQPPGPLSLPGRLRALPHFPV